MADIELVIKIPEELYEAYKGRPPMLGDAGIDMIAQSIANGTPLPKGHGRLIVEPTEEEIFKTIGGKNDFADCIREAVKIVFTNAPTIIEADKGESEE